LIDLDATSDRFSGSSARRQGLVGTGFNDGSDFVDAFGNGEHVRIDVEIVGRRLEHAFVLITRQADTTITACVLPRLKNRKRTRHSDQGIPSISEDVAKPLK
jgi:hypothetical protein